MVLNGEIQSINQDIERMIKQPKLIRFHKNGHYSLRYDDDKGKWLKLFLIDHEPMRPAMDY